MLPCSECRGGPKHARFFQRHQGSRVALELLAHIPPCQGSGKLGPAHHSCGHNSSISPGSCSGLNEAAEKAPQEMQPLRHKKWVLLSTSNGLKNRKRRSGEDSQFSYGSVIAVTFHRGLGLCSDLGCSVLRKRPGKGVRREGRAGH